jgi:hypothetical protein
LKFKSVSKPELVINLQQKDLRRLLAIARWLFLPSSGKRKPRKSTSNFYIKNEKFTLYSFIIFWDCAACDLTATEIS